MRGFRHYWIFLVLETGLIAIAFYAASFARWDAAVITGAFYACLNFVRTEAR